MNGNWCHSTDDIHNAFVEYYQWLLGTEHVCSVKVDPSIIALGKTVSQEHVTALSAPFSKEEIRKAMYGILGIKA
uniref:Uncharacterized protein n=1 Tax=Chenopodium quinoa TaxID=63459 RepID=A0A803LLU7_CHEQI